MKFAGVNINLETLKEHQAALKEKFGGGAAVAYAQVCNTQLSVARHYGGATVNSQRYTYNPTDDSLIRDDVIKWLAKHIKQKQKQAKAVHGG